MSMCQYSIEEENIQGIPRQKRECEVESFHLIKRGLIGELPAFETPAIRLILCQSKEKKILLFLHE